MAALVDSALQKVDEALRKEDPPPISTDDLRAEINLRKKRLQKVTFELSPRKKKRLVPRPIMPPRPITPPPEPEFMANGWVPHPASYFSRAKV